MIEALISKLLATAPIAAAVGENVTPGVRDQASAGKALVVNTIGDQPDVTHAGTSGLSLQKVQIDAWASTWLDARNLARLVTDALHGQRFTHAGVSFQGSFQKAARDSFEGENPRLHRTSLEFEIWSST